MTWNAFHPKICGYFNDWFEVLHIYRNTIVSLRSGNKNFKMYFFFLKKILPYIGIYYIYCNFRANLFYHAFTTKSSIIKKLCIFHLIYAQHCHSTLIRNPLEFWHAKFRLKCHAYFFCTETLWQNEQSTNQRTQWLFIKMPFFPHSYFMALTHHILIIVVVGVND